MQITIRLLASWFFWLFLDQFQKYKIFETGRVNDLPKFPLVKTGYVLLNSLPLLNLSCNWSKKQKYVQKKFLGLQKY